MVLLQKCMEEDESSELEILALIRLVLDIAKENVPSSA